MQKDTSQSSEIASFHLRNGSQECNIFTSEPGTYYNDRRWKLPFFSFIQTVTWLQPIISPRKCANTTEKMSSRYWSTANKKTQTLKLKVMPNRSLLTAYLHVHMSFCVCACVQLTKEEDIATPLGKYLLLWTQAWCKCAWIFHRPWTPQQ